MDVQSAVNTSLRLGLLAALIFAAVTYFPTTPEPLNTRLLITFVVVLIYSSANILGRIFPAFRDKICQWLCGCSYTSYDATDPSYQYQTTTA